jgi:hypothetical protein
VWVNFEINREIISGKKIALENNGPSRREEKNSPDLSTD